MSIEQQVPNAIINYLRARQDGNTDALLDTIDIDGTVYDGDDMYRGHQAVGDWSDRMKDQPQVGYEILEATKNNDDAYFVKVRMTGDTPSTPSELTFRFTMTGHKIDTVGVAS